MMGETTEYLYIGPSGFSPVYGMLSQDATVLVLTTKEASEFGPHVKPASVNINVKEEKVK